MVRSAARRNDLLTTTVLTGKENVSFLLSSTSEDINYFFHAGAELKIKYPILNNDNTNKVFMG